LGPSIFFPHHIRAHLDKWYIDPTDAQVNQGKAALQQNFATVGSYCVKLETKWAHLPG
jgi:hypothetical protein